MSGSSHRRSTVVKDDALELHVPAVRLLVDRAASTNVEANGSSFIYATPAIRPENGAENGAEVDIIAPISRSRKAIAGVDVLFG
jgi:hypothetical protein